MRKLASLLCALMLSLMPSAAESKPVDYAPTEYEIEKIAKTLYGECRSNDIPTMEKAAVVWCILNRCDAWGETIDQVVNTNHFSGYRKDNPVIDELMAIAEDVVLRWQLEKIGVSADVGRVLPKEYLYFSGRDGKNHFRTTYRNGTYWGWDSENPYETKE